MKAAEKFDPGAGCRFSTYGTWWIKQAIRRALTNTVKSVRVPGYMSEMISKWRNVSNELAYRLGRTPAVEEVAQELGVPRESWPLLKRTIETSGSGSQVSLDILSATQDTVEDERTPNPEDQIVHADLISKLEELLDVIDEREATILRLRYGLDSPSGEPMTLKEIGRVVGLTRERVRQIEQEALRKLYDQNARTAPILLLEVFPVKSLFKSSSLLSLRLSANKGSLALMRQLVCKVNRSPDSFSKQYAS